MKSPKIAVACALAVLGATIVGTAAHAGGSTATCGEGVKTIAGVSARTFCGPANARVKLNGKGVSFNGGSCSTSIGLFSVNVGTVVLGTVKGAPEYFGLTAKAKAGTQSRQTVSIVHGGATRGIIGTVTLNPGLKSGTFSGKVFGSSATVSGSFSC